MRQCLVPPRESISPVLSSATTSQLNDLLLALYRYESHHFWVHTRPEGQIHNIAYFLSEGVAAAKYELTLTTICGTKHVKSYRLFLFATSSRPLEKNCVKVLSEIMRMNDISSYHIEGLRHPIRSG